MSSQAMKYALISVSDKTGIDILSQALLARNYSILSTGGTFRYLHERTPEPLQSRLIQVSDFTGFPEILNGRVKTLHPKIYGSLLARREVPEHLEELKAHQIPLIDLVVVNLYPFHRVTEGSIEKNNMDEAMELVDIGGVTLIRAAAKNWQSVLVLTDPKDYSGFLAEYNRVTRDFTYRQRLAAQAFRHTSNYDEAIANYLVSDVESWGEEVKSTVTRSYSAKHNLLKYGCNPHQSNSYLLSLPVNSPDLPFQVLNGTLGYINVLDALNSWQLVSELRQTINLPAVASFKHTSPAGVAVYRPLSPQMLEVYGGLPKDLDLSPLANAFLRARNSDPKSSFGDFIALSETCDLATAKLIGREVSDGVVAPDYTPEALAVLSNKKNGNYLVLKMDPFYQPTDNLEYREMFGLALVQERNRAVVDLEVFEKPENLPTKNKEVSASARVDLLLANLTLKYAQSNNVVLAKDGQVIGVAAGQQSRVDAVKLAGSKASVWYLRQHPKTVELWSKFRKDVPVKRQDKVNALIRYVEGDFTDLEYPLWVNLFESAPELLTEEEKQEFLQTLDEVSLASDAFFPFRDNIDHASRFGVSYVMQPGGSLADKGVTEACDQYGMAMVMTGKRMFTH